VRKEMHKFGIPLTISGLSVRRFARCPAYRLKKEAGVNVRGLKAESSELLLMGNNYLDIF
jgi:hypothetical protein